MPKIKILKYVAHHIPGDVIEVDEETAKAMCHVSHIDDGVSKVEHRKAMRLEEVEKFEAHKIDASKMSQAEFDRMGLKNIVHTPHDPILAKRLEDLKAFDESKQEDEAPKKKGKQKKDE